MPRGRAGSPRVGAPQSSAKGRGRTQLWGHVACASQRFRAPRGGASAGLRPDSILPAQEEGARPRHLHPGSRERSPSTLTLPVGCLRAGCIRGACFLFPHAPRAGMQGAQGPTAPLSHEDGTGDKVPNNHEPQPQNPLRQQQRQHMAVDCVDSELQLTLGWGWGRWAGGAGPGLGCWLWVQHRDVGGRAVFAQEAAAAPRGRWAGGRPQECRGDTGTQSVNTSAAVQPPGDVVGMRSEGSVRRAWVGLSQPRIYRRSGGNTWVWGGPVQPGAARVRRCLRPHPPRPLGRRAEVCGCSDAVALCSRLPRGHTA